MKIVKIWLKKPDVNSKNLFFSQKNTNQANLVTLRRESAECSKQSINFLKYSRLEDLEVGRLGNIFQNGQRSFWHS